MPWVVKIGGSLYNSNYLIEWLHALLARSQDKIVIVPGGGPFAEQVRQVDLQVRLAPQHVHFMAVLAMQQYAHMLASLSPELCLARSKAHIHACWEQQKVAVWEPYDLVTQACRLEKTWAVTSDSLAVWLAQYLSIERLIVVKSSDKVLVDRSLDELARCGCIDAGLPILLKNKPLRIDFVHKSQAREFRQ